MKNSLDNTVKELRKLTIRSFHINNVDFGAKTKIDAHTLTVNSDLDYKNPLVKKVNVDVILPDQWNREINTIMDVIPISTKVLGEIGEGITHTLTGVYVILTGVDEDGRQMHEFGSSDGILAEKLFKNRPGTPKNNDILIHIDVLLKGGEPFERNLPMAAFRVADKLIDSIRVELKEKELKDADEVNEYFDRVRANAKKVVIVKQVAGQGAMYDNMLFASEPSGIDGLSVIDMANMPVLLSPNEYRDGALRALV
ncbi:MAG: proline reductase cluster protein PrdD [Treponema sp.]|nr:MAG: proline reductase cluster protein PrdD [Treponema sp.]